MNDIDDKLLELYKEINRIEKLKIHIVHLDEIIKIKAQEKESLEITLAKEENDVIATENLTLYSLFFTILGTRDRQLEKERQEYLHALMMYQGAEQTYISLIQERNLIIKSLNGLHVVEREFVRLIKIKDKLLNDANSYPNDLITLNERIASYTLQITAIELAIKKGNLSKNKLRKIIFDLKRIQKWGFEGRDYNSSSMLNKTKAVQKDIYAADNFLQQYEDQLYEISVHFNLNFDKQIKHFEAFLDRFVDSLITDWVVNNRIENSIHIVNNMIDTITKFNGSLEYQQAKVKNFLDEDLELKGHIILELINLGTRKGEDASGK